MHIPHARTRPTGPHISNHLPLLVACAALVGAACGRSSPDAPALTARQGELAATVVSLATTPPTASLPATVRQQFKATLTYSNGKTKSPSTGIAWSVSNPSLASVDATGLVTALAPGAVTVRATYTANGVSGQSALTITPATLTSLAVTPVKKQLAVGATATLKATGTFSDGTTFPLAGAVTWSSGAPAIASVDSNGVVTGLTAGTVAITATHTASGLKARATITVGTATLKSIAVTPPAPSVPNGLTVNFMVTGTYSDGSTEDLTSVATWTSSSTAVAAMSTDTPGAATAAGVGGTTITATVNGKKAKATLTVTAAVLSSIAISPSSSKVPKGTTQHLTATGTYSDHTTQDVTALVTWSSSSSATASISNAAGSSGLVTALALGAVTITATDPTTGVSASTPLTVTAAILQSLTISPPVATTPLGLTQQLTATGTYTDSTTRDVTAAVTWSSMAPTIAAVSNDPASAGLVTTLAVGAASVGAYDPATKVSASAAITVTAAVLKSIAINPPTISVANGLTEQFAATGIYSDGSHADITPAVSWSVTVGSATISSASGSAGLATTNGVGVSTVQALDPTTGLTGTAQLTVTKASLVSLGVTPAAASIPLGTTQQFTAMGLFTDGTTRDLTSCVTWGANNGNATLSNVAGSSGLATGTSVGSVMVTATFPATGTTGSTTMTVTPAQLVSIDLFASWLSPPAGIADSLFATGTYTDGTTQDLTATVTWISSDPTVFAISSGGVGTGLRAGTVLVSAVDPASGISGATTIDVTSAILRSIAVRPTSFVLPAGRTIAMNAIGTYSDKSTRNITDSVTWTTVGPAVVTNGPLPSVAGLFTGVSAGQAGVMATDPSTGVRGGATGVITPATLVSIAVTPGSAQVPSGLSQQFRATGTYTDGSTQDLTGSVTWQSTSASATISNAPGSVGLATAGAVGTATITAIDHTTGVSGSASMAATTAVLQSLAVSPPAPSIPLGLSSQLHATGMFSDGSSLDLTNLVTWSSAASPVASVSNAVGSTGLVTGMALGSATVTGTDPATGIAASATVTVTPAVVVSLTVTPPTANLFTGQRQQMTAMATKSDGTTADYTGSVTWSSSSASVFASNDPWSYGVVTGTSAGGATVTATDGTSGVTGTATVSVSIQTADSVSQQFSPDVNPVGDWTYGAASSVGGQVTPLPAVSVNNLDQATWSDGAGTRLSYNGSPQVELLSQPSGDYSYLASGQLALTPSNGEQAVVRWTAPATGSYQASATFTAAGNQQVCSWNQVCYPYYYQCNPYSCDPYFCNPYVCGPFGSTCWNTCYYTCWNECESVSCSQVQQCSYPSTSANVAVVKGSASVFSSSVNGTTATYTGNVFVHAGDTLDFEVGRGSNAQNSVILNASVTGGATCASASQSGAGQLVGLVVTPAAANATASGTTTFHASAYYSNQPRTPVDVTSQVSWSGSGVASVGSGGVASYGSTPGTGTVTAQLNGLTASAALRVWDPARVAQMSGLSLSAGALGGSGYVWNTSHGACYPISATVSYADGTSEDVTATTVWGGGQPVLFGNLLTINSDGSDNYFSITASLGSGFPSLSQTIGVWGARFAASCADPRVPGAAWKVTVSSPTTTPALGQTEQLGVTANYADGSLRDATASASWTTCNGGVADVSSDGWLTGAGPGTAIVLANVGVQAGAATISVQPAPASGKLTALYVQPTANNLGLGASAPARAVATYDNLGGALFNVTSQATWTTTDGAVVAVSPGTSPWSMTITGNAIGTSIVSARSGGLTATENVRIWDPSRLAAVRSTSLAIPNSFPQTCDAQQLSLTATYADGTTEDVSWSTQWSPLGASNYLFVSPTGLVTLVGNPNGYIYVTGSMGRGIDQPQSAPFGWWAPCAPPTCFDGMHNGAESDVDCGGESCQPCAAGERCNAHSDCSGGTCLGGTCQ